MEQGVVVGIEEGLAVVVEEMVVKGEEVVEVKDALETGEEVSEDCCKKTSETWMQFWFLENLRLQTLAALYHQETIKLQF